MARSTDPVARYDARIPSAAVPARSVSDRMDVETDRPMAASAAEIHRTANKAPPCSLLHLIDIGQIFNRTVGAYESGHGQHGKARRIGRRGSHLDTNPCGHVRKTPSG